MATGKLPMSQMVSDEHEAMERRLEKLSYRIRVAMPGIIQSFDTVKQTVSVKLAIREHLSFWGKPFEDLEIPILDEVPIFMPRAGNFILTMPIKAGDECLVIFTDNCYDEWWINSGVGNQLDNRRHDLSDGIAILGIWSQPNVITNYSTDSAVLRNLADDCYVEVKDSDINIIAPTKITITAGETVEVNAPTVEVNSTNSIVNAEEKVEVNAPEVEVIASVSAQIQAPIATIQAATINLNGNVSAGGGTNPVQITGGAIQITGGSISLGGTTTIEDKIFLAHTHSGVEPGGGNTGGVV